MTYEELYDQESRQCKQLLTLDFKENFLPPSHRVVQQSYKDQSISEILSGFVL